MLNTVAMRAAKGSLKMSNNTTPSERALSYVKCAAKLVYNAYKQLITNFPRFDGKAKFDTLMVVGIFIYCIRVQLDTVAESKRKKKKKQQGDPLKSDAIAKGLKPIFTELGINDEINCNTKLIPGLQQDMYVKLGATDLKLREATRRDGSHLPLPVPIVGLLVKMLLAKGKLHHAGLVVL